MAEELISVCMLSQVFPPHKEVYCLEWEHVSHGRRVDKRLLSQVYPPHEEVYCLEWEHLSHGRRVDKCMHVVTSVPPS